MARALRRGERHTGSPVEPGDSRVGTWVPIRVASRPLKSSAFVPAILRCGSIVGA